MTNAVAGVARGGRLAAGWDRWTEGGAGAAGVGGVTHPGRRARHGPRGRGRRDGRRASLPRGRGRRDGRWRQLPRGRGRRDGRWRHGPRGRRRRDGRWRHGPRGRRRRDGRWRHGPRGRRRRDGRWRHGPRGRRRRDGRWRHGPRRRRLPWCPQPRRRGHRLRRGLRVRLQHRPVGTAPGVRRGAAPHRRLETHLDHRAADGAARTDPPCGDLGRIDPEHRLALDTRNVQRSSDALAGTPGGVGVSPAGPSPRRSTENTDPGRVFA
jgi:hypothetical protein